MYGPVPPLAVGLPPMTTDPPKQFVWAGPALAVGFAGLSSHYCLTNALNAGDASVVIPFDFLRLPLIAVLAWMIYGEPLDPMVFAGGALIFAGVIWSLRGETRRAKKLQ